MEDSVWLLADLCASGHGGFVAAVCLPSLSRALSLSCFYLSLSMTTLDPPLVEECNLSEPLFFQNSFGEFQKVLNPGCVCIFLGCEDVRVIDMRTQSFSVTSDSKTKDNVTVAVSTMVHFRIDPRHVYEAAYTVIEPNRVVQSLIDDVVRSELPKLTLDESYEAKATMVHEIKNVLQEGMARYGYEIESVHITDLRPDASVLRAMNEINAARRLREAAIDKAEAEKILAVKAGEADAETKYLSGVGVARMRSAITDGFNDNINKMKHDNGMTPQEVVSMMLTTQYLDVLNAFATNGRGSIVVPHGLSVPTEMQAAVRDGMIQAAAMRSDI